MCPYHDQTVPRRSGTWAQQAAPLPQAGVAFRSEGCGARTSCPHGRMPCASTERRVMIRVMACADRVFHIDGRMPGVPTTKG